MRVGPTIVLLLIAALTGCGSSSANEPSAGRTLPTRPDSYRPASVRGPFLLVTLASLGTVTWRCDPAREGPAADLPGLALGFRSPSSGATERVRLRAGGRTIVSRVVQPGQRLNLPYLGTRLQQLDVTQEKEAGTLRAFISVDFAPHKATTYCWPYSPPRIDVRLLPLQK